MNQLKGGFKLHRFEVYHWGTFHHQVWVLSPQGMGALLTGENGSGKSTLVDALLTLLVPNQKRNYNLASGSEKKERTELTYVRGAYGREQNDLGQGQVKYLRQEQDYSILLACFKNEENQDSITIGQFFWMEQSELKKFYFISHSEIGIESHLSGFKTVQELRRKLKEIPQTSLFTVFSDYQAYFIQYVGLRSEKGLDLFNQITAIKEIGRLNEFVRKHMLNASEVQDLLTQLDQNYKNLNLSYLAIVQAREQLEVLSPLSDEAKKMEKIQKEEKEWIRRRILLPSFFADHKKQALLKQRKADEEKVQKGLSLLSDLDSRLQSLNQQKLELNSALNQDQTGQELERFDLLLRQQKEKCQDRKLKAEQYELLVSSLRLDPQLDRVSFDKNRKFLPSLKQQKEAQLVQVQDQLYQTKKNQDQQQEAIEKWLGEFQSMKKRKSLVPSRYTDLREELAEKVGTAPKNLPFVAEFIRVKPSESEWEGAIEKLLFSFALRLIVPEEFYSKVNQFLQNRNTGMKLVYQRLTEEDCRELNGKPASDLSLWHKLEFSKSSPYVSWVKNQILKTYDYACVNQLSIFQKQFKAMTSQGLLKHGTSLHEKDDRFAVQDQSRFILGWENQDQLEWIQKQIQITQGQLDQRHKEVEKMTQTFAQLESDLIAIRTLEGLVDFTSIDWPSVESEREKIQARKELLSQKSHRVVHLRKNLDQLEREWKKLQADRDASTRDVALAQHALTTLQIDLDFCEKVLASQEMQGERSFDLASLQWEWLEKILKKHKRNLSQLSIREYAFAEKEVQLFLEEAFQEREKEKQGLVQSLIRKMAHFKTRFSEVTQNLEASLDYLPEYLSLKRTIEMEALPEHERRFKKLLNQSVSNDLAAFKSSLDLAYEEIQETLDALNESLKKIHYSETTYIQLQLARSKDVEIRQFQTALKHCLLEMKEEGGTIEKGFAQIKSLLDRLRSEERWCKKVTDVRQWADFFVQERFFETQEPKNFYSDSAGLSGGQKAKLAFTILASAVAYQYGLSLNESQAGKKSSFRFMMVDEAFSKSDEKNSRYAMQLFQSLGLQVMVVTPRDKIHVVEPYVNHIFLTQMQEAQNTSSVWSLPFEMHQKSLSPSLTTAHPPLQSPKQNLP